MDNLNDDIINVIAIIKKEKMFKFLYYTFEIDQLAKNCKSFKRQILNSLICKFERKFV
tara:strand:+ start:72 stop:245 length:174 start_codon:yes stop_codon:yes gene_type:complete